MLFKAAIISDVHGNLEALNAVIDDINKKKKILYIINLGDSVDYGPDSVECFNLCARISMINLIGNHEGCLIDQCRPSVTPHGHISRQILKSQFDASMLYTLGKMRPHARWKIRKEVVLDASHAGTSDYYWGKWDIEEFKKQINLEYADEIENLKFIAFSGHTHKPSIELFDDGKIIHINPGAVGQPRDENPEASYATLVIDDALGIKAELHRVSYDIKSVQDKMIKRKYPQYLIDRLAIGH